MPLILSGPDGQPKLFDIPEVITMRIKITHPTIAAFADLGLEWYGLPAVSGMLLEMGGIQLPACPFSGWYATSEIATRDLLDVQRYNLLQVRPTGESQKRSICSSHRISGLGDRYRNWYRLL